MESKITIEIRRDGDAYSSWIYNDSKSVSRLAKIASSEMLTTMLAETAIELLGDTSADGDEKVALMEENEDVMEEAFMKEYNGSKDGWEEALWNWEANISLEEVKAILATQPKETEQPSVTGV